MAEAYSQGIARVVVAQLAEAAGFEGGLQSSALDTLVDLLLRFIAEGSAGAKSLAELANRSAVNIADLVRVSCRTWAHRPACNLSTCALALAGLVTAATACSLAMCPALHPTTKAVIHTAACSAFYVTVTNCCLLPAGAYSAGHGHISKSTQAVCRLCQAGTAAQKAIITPVCPCCCIKGQWEIALIYPCVHCWAACISCSAFML